MYFIRLEEGKWGLIITIFIIVKHLDSFLDGSLQTSKLIQQNVFSSHLAKKLCSGKPQNRLSNHKNIKLF